MSQLLGESSVMISESCNCFCKDIIVFAMFGFSGGER